MSKEKKQISWLAFITIILIFLSNSSIVLCQDVGPPTKIPRDIELMLSRGYNLFIAGKHEEAQAEFKKVLEKDPANPVALNNLAAIMVKQNKLDKAKTYLEEALPRAKGYKILVNPVCCVQDTCIAIEPRQIGGKKQDLGELVELNLKMVEEKRRRGRHYPLRTLSLEQRQRSSKAPIQQEARPEHLRTYSLDCQSERRRAESIRDPEIGKQELLSSTDREGTKPEPRRVKSARAASRRDPEIGKPKSLGSLGTKPEPIYNLLVEPHGGKDPLILIPGEPTQLTFFIDPFKHLESVLGGKFRLSEEFNEFLSRKSEGEKIKLMVTLSCPFSIPSSKKELFNPLQQQEITYDSSSYMSNRAIFTILPSADSAHVDKTTNIGEMTLKVAYKGCIADIIKVQAFVGSPTFKGRAEYKSPTKEKVPFGTPEACKIPDVGITIINQDNELRVSIEPINPNLRQVFLSRFIDNKTGYNLWDFNSEMSETQIDNKLKRIYELFNLIIYQEPLEVMTLKDLSALRDKYRSNPISSDNDKILEKIDEQIKEKKGRESKIEKCKNETTKKGFFGIFPMIGKGKNEEFTKKLESYEREMNKEKQIRDSYMHNPLRNNLRNLGSTVNLRAGVMETLQFSEEDKKEILHELGKWGSMVYFQIFRRNQDLRSAMEIIENWRAERPLRINIWSNLSKKERYIPWQILYNKNVLSRDNVDPSAFWGFRYVLSATNDSDMQTGHQRNILGDASPDQIAYAAHTSEDQVVHDRAMELKSLIEDRIKENIGKNREISGHQSKEKIKFSIKESLGTEQFLLRLRENAEVINLVFAYGHGRISTDMVGDEYRIKIHPIHFEFSSDNWLEPDHLEQLETLNVQFNKRPIVIFNACELGTSGPVPTKNIGFINPLFKLKAGAVIVAEAPVWNHFAYAFCKDLIDELLYRKVDISQAIYEVRRKHLEKNNPLGLIYTLYGNGSVKF